MKKITLNKPLAGLILLSAFILILFSLPGCKQEKLTGKLTVWEDSISIPTYLMNPPNPMPRFYEGGAHQGVKRRSYPYPVDDNMTQVKENRNYHIVYLENDYIKIGVMPQLGGRIYEAYDKSNGYKFFYRNDVIKPSMIGMLGFWISGGNAWGFPHHHGANTVAPMDYTIEKNPDGSATVWMAYTENIHRMRVYLGFTMYPNSSIVEMTARPYNPMPNVNSFLFWANPSVHCDTNYQVIFPPSVEYVTQHHKNEMTTWPVADRRYNRVDYTGMDISMWKNTIVPSSFFSWDPQEDFFGGYDHGLQAGTAWLGNHHICPGMKYWADGNNASGRIINDGLTDSSGRYIELMAGAYTDNQPDYSWLQPYESKDITMKWFPIRDLGGLIQANENGALNFIAGENGEVSIRLNATRLFQDARVRVTNNGREVFTEIINISPLDPYLKDLTIEGIVAKEDLTFTFLDASDNLLMEYRPMPPPGNPMPEPITTPPAPENVASVEELFYHGLRLDQFHNASIDPYPYYYEALRRDPGDYRVNTQLGILSLVDKKYAEAEKYLQTAVDRITMRYTRPKDSDALYYLGVVQRRLNKNKEAYDHLYDATWNVGWNTPAYHQLAEMDCGNGDFERALGHIDRAISTDINNLKALNLKVAVLRKLGRLDEAEKLAGEIMAKDLLDYQSRNEMALVLSARNKKGKAGSVLEELDRIMADREHSYLELAAVYSNCGLYGEAIGVLERIAEKGNTFPIIYYYLGYFWSKLDNRDKAMEYFETAQSMPHTYCFPFRDESLAALTEAISYRPGDAMAYYYLGNMFYEGQPEKAVAMWEKSLSLDDSFYIVQRNLALAAQEDGGDLGRSISLYGDAFANNREDPRLMYEYDMILEQAGVPPQERYEKIFAGNREIAMEKTATLLREMEILVLLGHYDEAIDILTNTTFVETEGARTLRDVYCDAFILRSLRNAGAGDFDAAISDLRMAMDYPIGRWGSERRAQMNYLMGTYQEGRGDGKAARTAYESAASELVEGTEFHYEKGLALGKLGRTEEAKREFTALLDLAGRTGDRDAFRSFERGATGNTRLSQGHYLRGLAYLGMGRRTEAGTQFARAVELYPANVWAARMLKN